MFKKYLFDTEHLRIVYRSAGGLIVAELDDMLSSIVLYREGIVTGVDLSRLAESLIPETKLNEISFRSYTIDSGARAGNHKHNTPEILAFSPSYNRNFKGGIEIKTIHDARIDSYQLPTVHNGLVVCIPADLPHQLGNHTDADQAYGEITSKYLKTETVEF